MAEVVAAKETTTKISSSQNPILINVTNTEISGTKIAVVTIKKTGTTVVVTEMVATLTITAGTIKTTTTS